ncbi:MAG: outer membrane lipoprotein carrier protein LolA [Acidobacteriota bacterium]
MKEYFQKNKRRAGLQWVIAGLGAWSALALMPVLLLALGSPASLPLDQYIKRVQQSYHDVRAIRADFKQTYDSGGRIRVESGTVTFARGGRMRWDYRMPEKKIFLSNKKEVLLYLPDERPA